MYKYMYVFVLYVKYGLIDKCYIENEVNINYK